MAARLTMQSSVRVPDRTATRQVDTETILLNLESGIYFGLDEIGTRMWQLMTAGTPLGDVHQALLGEYEVDPGRLEADLLALVEQLAARGLVDVEAGDRAE